MIIGIVAIAKNYAIGRNGTLPWHYAADLRHFKRTTTGNALVMGSTTWKSIGKPLPDRLSIVVSRSDILKKQPRVVLAQSTDEVLALVNYLNCDVYVIGGAKTFESFSDLIEKWIVTEVPVTVDDADVFMPRHFLDGFRLEDVEELGEGLKVKILSRT